MRVAAVTGALRIVRVESEMSKSGKPSPNDVAVGVFGGACGGIAYVPYLFFHNRAAARRERYVAQSMRERPPTALGPHTIELTEQGITARTKDGTTSCPWPPFVEASMEARDIVLYSRNKIAICIPLRAFPSSVDAARFLEAAKQCISRHQESGHARL